MGKKAYKSKKDLETKPKRVLVNRLNRSRGKWLVDNIVARGLPVLDVARALDMSKKNFYMVLCKPKYLSVEQVTYISAVTGIELRHILAWVFGCGAVEIAKRENDGSKYWFEMKEGEVLPDCAGEKHTK